MFCCNNCKKSFKTNWQLQRHLGKKIQCKPNLPNVPVECIKLPNFHKKSTEVPTESKTEHAKNSAAVDSLTCEYCLVTFANKKNLRLHGERCKLKEDPVRCMEIELNKNVNRWSKNECRFCDYKSIYTRHVTRHLTSCKKRKEYKAALEAELQIKNKSTHESKVTNNITHNNVTNVNVTNNMTNNINIIVNPLGQENYSYITCNQIMSLCKKTRSDEEFFAKTLTMIHAHPKHPENHNIVLTNHRSNLALVKVKDQFEFRSIDDIINKAAAKMLDNIIFETDFEDVPKDILLTYEAVCEEDELNPKAARMFKQDLYSKHKNGCITKPSIEC
jgi:hypothetical protein